MSSMKMMMYVTSTLDDMKISYMPLDKVVKVMMNVNINSSFVWFFCVIDWNYSLPLSLMQVIRAQQSQLMLISQSY